MHGDHKARKLQSYWCLKAESKQQEKAFITDICNRLGAEQLSSGNPEENWTVFRNAVHSSAVDTYASCKHQNWFDENDEEIQGPLEETHRMNKARQDDTSSVSKKAAYNNICKSVQSRLRDMQDSFLAE